MINLREAARMFVSAHMGENITLENAFVGGAVFAYLKGDWRSAKDEPPTSNEDVLADVIVAYGDKIVHEHEKAYLNNIGQWFTPDGEAVNVVNWMPLPELPNK